LLKGVFTCKHFEVDDCCKTSEGNRYQLDIGEGVLHLVVSFLYSDTVRLM